jgi:hypothetical protein
MGVGDAVMDHSSITVATEQLGGVIVAAIEKPQVSCRYVLMYF